MNDQSPAVGGSAEILIVEDSATQAQQLKHVLEKGGYRVSVASNGLEALDAAKKTHPTLIISDVNMPQMDGYELCRLMKDGAETSGIPFILVTALSDPHDVIRGLECGADHFIPKPYDSDQMLARVQLLLLNRTMDRVDRPGMGLEIYFNGQRHFIAADRLQILNLLLSTYEAAVEKNRKLSETQDALRHMNRNLEDLVAERTQKLIDSEERFRQLAENSEEGFWFVSVNPERMLYVSPAIEKIWGLPAEYFARSAGSRLAVVHPDDREEVRAAFEAAISGQSPVFSAEYRVARADGSIRWVSDQGTPIRDASGTIVRMGGVCRDITEQRLAQERLAESERFSRATLNALPAFIAVLDGQGRLVFTNQAWRKFSHQNGWPINRGSERPDYMAFCDQAADAGIESAGKIARLIRETIAGESDAGEFEYAIHTVEGQKWFSCRVSRFPGEGHLRLVVSHTDITARKQAELAMERSQKQFQDLFESAPDAMIIADARGAIVLVNEQAERIFDWTKAELAGQPVERLIRPEEGSEPISLREEYVQSALPRRMGEGRSTLLGIRKDGTEFPVEITLSPLESEDEPLVVAAVRDITERKQLEARFLQAQKMESVGQLAGGIAHDFNNLLTVINGTAELAIDHMPQEHPVHSDLREILDTGIRAAALTRQLLAFSRKQILQPRVVDLNQVVAEAEGMLRRIIGENIELAFLPGEDLATVRVDPAQMEQVIVNLAVNSRDAMPTGGKLTIATSNVAMDETFIGAVSGVHSGPFVLLEISDTGGGMDKATQEKMFEPFFTTKGIGKGTGLGLSTAYGIVKQSGGDIRVYSEIGQGTAIRIYLPRAEGPADVTKSGQAIEIAKGTETILVVDDDEGIIQVAERVLKAAGFTVITAGGGEEALEMLQTGRVGIDLMLTDVVMGGISGAELAHRVNAILPSVKILYASGYTDDTIVRHGVLSEGVHFISKPYTSAELTQKIRAILDS